MQMLSKTGLEARSGTMPWISRTAVAVAIGAGLMLTAGQASAQIIHSGPVNLTIPVSTNGLYLNVVTGANNMPAGSGGGTVPGWDINPWSSTGLGFFSPGLPAGGAYLVTSPGFVANLSSGGLIDGSGSFGSGTGSNVAQWNLNSSDNIFGFRFINEAGGTTHYGWARIALGATATDPSRTLVEYAFELTPGVGIQAGVIPEPSTYAMFALGLGVLLAARRRMKS
jgi:hypothetical protein